MTRRSRRTKRVKRSLTFNQRSRRKTRRVSRKGRKKVKRSRKRKRKTIKNKKGGADRCSRFKNTQHRDYIKGKYVGAPCDDNNDCRSCNCEEDMSPDEKKCVENDFANISHGVKNEINEKMTWENSPLGMWATSKKKKQQARDHVVKLKKILAKEPPPPAGVGVGEFGPRPTLMPVPAGGPSVDIDEAIAALDAEVKKR
jgi:hypothetical protein